MPRQQSNKPVMAHVCDGTPAYGLRVYVAEHGAGGYDDGYLLAESNDALFTAKYTLERALLIAAILRMNGIVVDVAHVATGEVVTATLSAHSITPPALPEVG